MDGNGRWANSKGLPRVAGHKMGVKTVRKITRACGELGVKVLTLYTFSSENWHRPENEVNALMKLFVQSLRNEIDNLMENNVKFTTIGDLMQLPAKVRIELEIGFEKTRNNTGLNLNLAFSYGSRQEIVRAFKKIMKKIVQNELTLNEIDVSLVSRHLYTAEIPDPDLLIRTGGEFRLSNFLLWQVAYSEIFVTDTFWPDFSKNELEQIIIDFQSRERRFGLTSDQLGNN